ncbi:MAG: PQQ-dependent sugar dehydrogenase [Granulosicoccus sp.]|nr:PQQ-dependent sugar dehydrogenase [Granulosicoccus sp.]
MAFNRPWAMVFLPDGQLLVTEKGGTLWLVNLPWDTLTDDGGATPVEMSAEDRTVVSGLPEIRSAGQGGLGDVILHPEFSENGLVYISYVEREGDLSGAAVARGTLDRSDKSNVKLVGLTVIWRQSPKVTGQGHYGHRLAFSADGHLFITSGERQKFDPAQSKLQNLGKIIRLNDDGSLPGDNPFAAAGGVTAEFWSLGHRNPLGIAFDRKTRLWVHEMGPRGGDELNLIKPGHNYGYPLVSDGDHYSGLRIPDHDTRPDLEAPAISWNPVISPSGLVIYDGDRFPEWRDTGLIGGLSSQSLVRVALEVPAREIERYGMGARIREVEQGPDGRVFLLEDGADGRLLHLSQR